MGLNCYIWGTKSVDGAEFPNARPQQSLNDSNNFILYFPYVIFGLELEPWTIDWSLVFYFPMWDHHTSSEII